MKKYFILAAAALAFAACTSDEIVPVEQVSQVVDDGVIRFDAYTQRPTTRAGWAGELTTAQLKSAADGFGVFGYYTNGELYSETAKPDFMYNQHVTFSGGVWAYAPLKYWPNEFGNNAASEEIDRLTFFAYAPYAAVTPTTGVVTDDAPTGIVGMSRNTSSGNPLIKYYSDLTPAKCVDLCWGVADEDFKSSVDGNANNVQENEPYIDVIKPKVGDKIKFDFKHALAQLNVQIDADIDVESHASSTIDGMTRIYVRSVTFEGFTTKGTLDLNSDYSASATTPNWFDISGNSKLSLEPITVYDGRRDGKEGVSSATAKNETPDDLNPNIIQNGAYTTTPVSVSDPTYATLTSTTNGVTNTAVNLFNSNTLDAPVLVIPTGEPMKVTIVYDVETADNSLSGYLSDGATRGSTIENAITQSIKLSDGSDMELASGKKYTVNLHLGMTSVKFEASVTPWDTGDDADVDLPYNSGNAPSLTATSTPYNSTNVTIPASATSYTFTVLGLDGTEAVTKTRTDAVTSINGDAAATDGSIVVEAIIGGGANTKTTKVTGTAQIVGNSSSKGVIYNITQEAHALGMTASALAAGGTTITLTPTATDVDWTAATITIKKTPSGDTERTLVKDTNYTVANGSGTPQPGTITLTGAAASGDKYVITVKSGDAEEETVTINV